MEQDDIFKLLLIILLLSNERENCPDATNGTSGQFSTFNEIIIIFLLFNAFSCPTTTQTLNDLRFLPRDTSF